MQITDYLGYNVGSVVKHVDNPSPMRWEALWTERRECGWGVDVKWAFFRTQSDAVAHVKQQSTISPLFGKGK